MGDLGGRGQFKIEDAASYDRVADVFGHLTERFSRDIAQDIVRAVDAPGRSLILDMGCGTGLLAQEAAWATDAGCRVVGIDLSEGMLDIAKRKAAVSGVDDRLDFAKGDAEALDWPDAVADGYVSLHAYRHFPHPQRAANEAFRVLRGGGRMAVAIGSPPRLASRAGLRRALLRLGQAGRMAMGRERAATAHLVGLVSKHITSVGEIEIAEWSESRGSPARMLLEYFRRAGFVDLCLGWSGSEFRVPTIQAFWDLQTTISTPARKRMARARQDELAALKNAFWADCEAVLGRGGRLTYRVGAAIVSGRKPR